MFDAVLVVQWGSDARRYFWADVRSFLSPGQDRLPHNKAWAAYESTFTEMRALHDYAIRIETGLVTYAYQLPQRP